MARESFTATSERCANGHARSAAGRAHDAAVGVLPARGQVAGPRGRTSPGHTRLAALVREQLDRRRFDGNPREAAHAVQERSRDASPWAIYDALSTVQERLVAEGVRTLLVPRIVPFERTADIA